MVMAMKYGKVKGFGKGCFKDCISTDYMTTQRVEQNFSMLDTAFELGCNTLDTAHVYGGGRRRKGYRKVDGIQEKQG